MNKFQRNIMGVFKADQEHHIILLRVTLAIFVAIHGWARFFSDAVAPFGDFLNGVGLPGGFLIAWSITLYEIIGSVFFALGWGTRYLSYVFSFIYFMGIVLVHYAEGWFVVGLGRNGMEYSVLLILCFIIVGYNAKKEY